MLTLCIGLLWQKSLSQEKAFGGISSLRRQSMAAEGNLRPGSSDQSDNSDDDEDDDDVKAAHLEG